MTSLSRRQFSTVTLLGGLSALAAPRSSAAQIEEAPMAQPISVAQPTVSITVNNVALTFLVDTSSPYSSINPDVASWLGLTPTGEQTIPGAGPTVQARLYGATLASGAGSLPFQLAAVDDLSLVSEPASSPEMEGILGADFLGQFSDFSLTDTSFTGLVGSTPGAGLDLAASNLALSPPFTVTYPVIKIGRDYYVLIEIVDGGGRRVTKFFLLDTGAQVSVLTTQQALNLGLLPLNIGPNPLQAIPAMVPIGGVGGGAIGLITPVGLPGLGSFTFVITNVPVRPGVAGLIGADVLGGSFTLQLNGGVGTLTITTPLGQVVEFFIGLFRSIFRAIGIEVMNLKIE
jgi:Aspartyl protease